MNFKFQIKNYRCFSDEHPAKVELRKGIHALVGPNNAGKSSLLKLFYDFRSLFAILQDTNQLRTAGDSSSVIGFKYPETVGDWNELFFDGNQRELEIAFDIEYNREELADLAPAPSRIVLTVPRGANHSHVRIEVNGRPLARDLFVAGATDLFSHSSSAMALSRKSVTAISEFLTRTLYIGSFRNAINIGGSEKYFDIQSGQAFIMAWKHFKSGAGKLNSEASRRLEKQLAKIFGYADLQINAFANDRELQIIADDKSYKSADMGGGILQFAIVLANAAMNSARFILIDEPELNLHPLLQLDFLTTIAAYASDGMMFATHSVGLARSSAETIYSVRRVKGSRASEVKSFEATNNLTELLGELGFNAYRDLGFSKVLLLEGPSDVKAVQQFLRRIGKDREILLLPLGGAAMINGNIDLQLQEIKRIGAKIFALIDSERTAPGAQLSQSHRDFVQKCADNEIKCCVLEKRAIENYLTDAAIKKVKGPNYSELMPYDRLKDAAMPWGKEENWAIAREMDRQDFEKTDLGQFLLAI